MMLIITHPILKTMKIGTKSLLFGVHQFVLHPVLVLWAWRILYKRWPKYYQLCAIVTHDWGYWGSPNMDGDEGEKHPEIIADWWVLNFGRLSLYWARHFGYKVADEILGHSRFYAGVNGLPLSKLFRADKLSVILYPTWFYLLLGTLSGEVFEFMQQSLNKGRADTLKKKGKGKVQWYYETASHCALMAFHAEDYPPVKRQMREDRIPGWVGVIKNDV